VPISAEHGEGLAELYERLEPSAAHRFPDDSSIEDEKPLQLAIVGRPNVGKSTVANRFLGEERLLTGPEAGIIRDAIAIDWVWRGRPIRLVDTAGLRRRPRVEGKPEELSVADALRAIRFAETVILVLDALHPFERQDLTIVRLVGEEGRALVLAATKWDAVAEGTAVLRRLRERASVSLPQLSGVALVPVSGLTGLGLDAMMKAVFAAEQVWNRRVSTADLNRWLAVVQERHPPPLVAGRRASAAPALYDPGQHASAELRALRLETRRTSRLVSALSRERAASGFPPTWYPDPDDAAQGHEPLPWSLTSPARSMCVCAIADVQA
jgi:GTPase